MILKAHLDGIPPHAIGDEIWHETLADAIRSEAQATIEHIPARLLALIGREQALDLVVEEMTAALLKVGDRYEAIDNVLYELLDDDSIDQAAGASLHAMTGASRHRSHLRSPADRLLSLTPHDRPLERRHPGRAHALVSRRDLIPSRRRTGRH
jgi:hypothetical protein